MSRRSRRQSDSKSPTKTKAKKTGVATWLARLLFLFLFTVALGSVSGYFWLKNYLASEKFRLQIVNQTGKLLRADVAVSPLRWDGFRVNSDSIEASGTSQCQSMKWDGIRTGIEIGSVAQGIWKVSPTRVGKISMVWDTTVKDIEDAPTESTKKSESKKDRPWYDLWIPKQYATESIIVDNTDVSIILKDGNVRLTETRWEIDPSANLPQATVNMDGGKLTLPYPDIPQIRINKATANYRNGNIYLANLRAFAYERGRILLSGDWNKETNALQLEGEVNEIQCREIVPSDWKQSLIGSIHATTSIKYADKKIQANGHFSLKNGILTALPVLDNLAAYLQSAQFRTLTLHSAECDYQYDDGILTLTNIQLGSEGLARLEGSCKFTPLTNGDTAIDGNFNLGLAPGTLATIPGAEEEVFLAGPRGLRWSSLRMTGTLQSPKEDLVARLRAVAAARMFDIIPETGAKVLKYTQKLFSGDVKETVSEKVSEKVIGVFGGSLSPVKDAVPGVVDAVTESTEKVVKGAVGGLLGGLLGGNEKPEHKPIPEPKPKSNNNN